MKIDTSKLDADYDLRKSLGSLRLESLERFVIDVSWCGPKKRTVLDMRETVVPLLQLLTRRDVKDRYGLPQKEKLSVLTF